MHSGPNHALSQRVHFRACEKHVLLACAAADFEIYCVLDPLVERQAAVGICNRLSAWLRSDDAEPYVGNYFGGPSAGTAAAPDWSSLVPAHPRLGM